MESLFGFLPTTDKRLHPTLGELTDLTELLEITNLCLYLDNLDNQANLDFGLL
jgi:hypothetical protein